MTSKIAQFESLLYVTGDNGISESDLSNLLEIDKPAVRQLAKKLADNLNKNIDSGLEIQKLNDVYKLTTSRGSASIVEKYFQKDLTNKISQSALEILSIIAYKQPVTRIEIDDIRGVNSTGALQTLIWRDLVKIEGKKEVPGHPNLYVTTPYFLQYFGYNTLADLPEISNFEDSQIDLFESQGITDKHLQGEENG